MPSPPTIRNHRPAAPSSTATSPSPISGTPPRRPNRAADETLDELAHARRAADTPDDLTAADAWRQIATLAGRLQHQAREVAILAAAEAGGGAP